MKKKIIIVSICLAVVLLISSVFLVSYDKFGTANVFAAANAFYRVTNTNADAITVKEHPQIMIAKPGIELLDRHMEALGYERVEEKQLGALIVYSNGSDEQSILYSQNKYFSKWEWQE